MLKQICEIFKKHHILFILFTVILYYTKAFYISTIVEKFLICKALKTPNMTHFHVELMCKKKKKKKKHQNPNKY